jgi:hypothetical protein
MVAAQNPLGLGTAQDFDDIRNAIPLVPAREPRDS